MLGLSEKPLMRRNSTQVAALKETNAPSIFKKEGAPDWLKIYLPYNIIL